MPKLSFKYRRLAAGMLAVCLCALTAVPSPVSAQPPAVKQPELRFSFEGAHWREVLGWVARESDLALQITDVPTGSLTYTDTRTDSPDEAIDWLNLFLIPRGFTLVRSGKLLSVISLDDERSLQQLDAMAELIPVEALATRGEHDVVKCLFQLGNSDPATVRNELRGLSLLREPIEFANSRQLLVTGTVGRLKTVQRIIETLETPSLERGPVRQFPLKNVKASDVLTVVRPLVGLVGAELVAGDISLSSDEDGTQVFATGTKDKVEIVAMVVEMLDAAADEPARKIEPLSFETHAVQAGNLQMVYEVLQTLLADKANEGLRLAQEFNTNRIAAYATTDVHETIRKTIEKLEADKVEFEVIDLKSVDPEYAVVLLRQMFDVDTGLSTDRNRLRVDADPLNQRLFVRGRKAEIEEIKSVVERLSISGVSAQGTLRMLPYQGDRARAILDAARNFWAGDNEVIVIPSGDGAKDGQLREQPVTPPASVPPPVNSDQAEVNSVPNAVPATARLPKSEPHSVAAFARTRNSSDGPGSDERGYNQPARSFPAKYVQPNALTSRAAIKAQVTPQGILIQCDDVAALNQFEEHLQLIAGPSGGFTQHIRVFYLSNEKAEVANRLLAELLGGTIRTGRGFGGSLISRLMESEAPAPTSQANASNVPPAPGLAETISSVLTAGTATIVPDTRLNRLFVQGTATDIAEIEAHLQIIDREVSLADVKTYGRPRVIELKHTPADEIADMLRDVYAGRVEKSNRQNNQRQAGQPQGQPNQRGNQQPQGQNPQQANQQQQKQTPVMTIAVSERSNAIIVTAPTQLAEEVESLTLALDGRGVQGVCVLRLNNPRTVEDALREIYGDQIRSPRFGGSR